MRRNVGALNWCFTPKILRALYDSRSGKFASEDFTEVVLLFLHRPQFQIDAGARLRG